MFAVGMLLTWCGHDVDITKHAQEIAWFHYQLEENFVGCSSCPGVQFELWNFCDRYSLPVASTSSSSTLKFDLMCSKQDCQYY